MKDVQDMTDEEYYLYRAREWAAGRYRAVGHKDFADRVERGLEDQCSQVRLGRFFFDDLLPHDKAFIVAWNEAAVPSDARTS